MPVIASSTIWPMVGCLAWAFRCAQRASGGTQKMLSARYSFRVLRIGTLRLLRFELRVLRFEGVGDVLEEDQAEHDVLVLGGVHATAQRVGHLPEPRFIADDRPVVGRGRGALLHLWHAFHLLG